MTTTNRVLRDACKDRRRGLLTTGCDEALLFVAGENYEQAEKRIRELIQSLDELKIAEDALVHEGERIQQYDT